MKKYLFFAFCIILCTQFANSQSLTQSISGFVKDNTSNEALPGANIVVANSDPLIGTVTDVNGMFRMENIPVGYVSLIVTYIGYQPVELSNLTLNSGKELVLNIFMDEMVITGEEVVIRARVDKTGSINRMTTVSSRTFTVDETRRYAGARNDVARMAANYAGVQTISDSRNDIIIRGNSPYSLLWRLEGAEIPNPNHFASFGSTGGPVNMINNNQLDNSDFLTSAFPAEFGNATSGVFDLSLRNGNPNKYEFLGQIGFNGFEFGMEGPISRKAGSSFTASYRYSTMQIFKLLGMSFGTGTAIPEYQDYTFKVNLPTKKAGTFSIFGMGGWSNIEFLDSERDTNEVEFYGGEGYDLKSGSRLFVTGFSHVFSISKTAYIKSVLSFSYTDFHVDQDSIRPDDKAIIPTYRSNFKESRVNLNMFIKKRAGLKNSFQAGYHLAYIMSDLNDSALRVNINRFIDITMYQGNAFLIQPYVAWQHKFTEDIIMNAGIRGMFYTFNSTYSIEPRLGLRWYLSPALSLNFGYGLHNQLLPATVYTKESYQPDHTYKRLNTDLKIPGSHHFVAGIDWNINEFMRFKTEAYYQYLFNAAVNADKHDSYSSLNQGADFYFYAPDTLKSNGTGYNYGLEFTIEQFLSKGMYYLGTVTLYQSKYKGSDDIERNTAFNGGFVMNALFGKEFLLHRNSTNPRLKKNQRFIGFDIKLNYAGGRRYIPIDEEQSRIEHRPVYQYDLAYDKKFPDYFRTDLKVYFKINMKKLDSEFAIDIQNIFNIQNIYAQNFNRSTGEIYYTYQLGIMVIPQFRINF